MNKPTYVFVRKEGWDKEPDIHVSKNKFFEDAIFEFVYNTLGYIPLKVDVDKNEEVKVDYV